MSEVPSCSDDCPSSPLFWIGGLGEPTDLVVLDGEVFWADVQLQEVAGSSETSPSKRTLASDLARPRSLVGIGGELYWADDLGDVIMKVSTSGDTEAEVLTAVQDPSVVAVDETHVYWSPDHPSEIWRIPHDGGASEPVWEEYLSSYLGNVRALAVDDQFLHASMYDGYLRLDKQEVLEPLRLPLADAGCSEKISVAGGEVSLVCNEIALRLVSVSEEGPDVAIGIDRGVGGPVVRVADFTYWTKRFPTGDDTFSTIVLMTPNCAGAAQHLAQVPGSIRDIAVSDEYVYFSVDDWIGRVPRAD
jgi:hypothetical protein